MSIDIHAERILILDFGSQYTQLIARRVREMGVYSEVYPFNIADEKIRDFAPKGIILSGGPESVSATNALKAPEMIFTLGIPLLGICYGMQTMAEQLGGKVFSGKHREFGYQRVEIKNPSPLLKNIEDHPGLLDVWMSHGDHVGSLPPHFSSMGSTDNYDVIGMYDEERHFYGLQFHPEVSHTHQGKKILERFILEICGCKSLWTTKNIIAELLQKIKTTVGNAPIILGLSGGVDSSVVAALLQKAESPALTAIFVDTGLLRLHEAEEVKNLFAKHMGLHIVVVDAKGKFYHALKGVSDPEDKRKIIGKLFIHIFEEEAKKIKNAKWLAQGTIYPDVIESSHASGSSHVIKSHHNVGGLPEKMHLQLCEPLRELFKDEVRKIGVELGLPKDLVYRHPFPGPGLGVRILGEIKSDYIQKLQLADAILMDELRRSDWYDKVSQAFVVFLPVKSVGVLGDARHYDHVVAIRVVETIDFMTAKVAHLPHAFLEKISNRIINEVPGISRVVYDISSKPPATIEWE